MLARATASLPDASLQVNDHSRVLAQIGRPRQRSAKDYADFNSHAAARTRKNDLSAIPIDSHIYGAIGGNSPTGPLARASDPLQLQCLQSAVQSEPMTRWSGR